VWQARNFAQNGFYGNRSDRIVTKPEFEPRPSDTRDGQQPTMKVIPEEDKKAIVNLIGEATAEKLVELDTNVQAKKQMSPEERNVVFDPITDRSQRAAVHQVCAPISRFPPYMA
jgi:hypothetical protein